MSDFNSLGKEYLRPDYSDEDSHFDDPIGGPSEDDDDIIEDDDDISDYDEGEEDKKIEELSKDREKLTEKIMQTPFGQPATSSSPWGQSSSPWGGGNNNSSPWGQNNNSPWGSQSKPTWGQSSSPWGGNNSPTWGSNSVGSKKEIDRQKEIIFCDVLDCLIETLASNGKPGLLPRGIYDIRLRFEVWDKIACFNPKKVYAIIPRNLILSSNGCNSWVVLLDYVICSLSEYLRVPYGNCQILTQKDFYQGKDLIIGTTLEKEGITKTSAIQIGLESGLYGQSNRDYIAAQKVGIDYIDLGQLMNLYY